MLKATTASLESVVHIALLVIPIHKITLMALFVAGAGLYFFFHGSRIFARRQSLARIPATTIRDASLGSVAITGTTKGPYTLSAPITGKPCFLYQTTVWQQRGSGKKQNWEKIAEEVLSLPFFIEDATGTLLVEPLGGELDLPQDFCQEYGALLSPLSQIEAPPRVSVFLARHGIGEGLPLRVEERSVMPQAQIFVAGTLMQNPGIRLRPFSPRTEDSTPESSQDMPVMVSQGSGMATQEVIRLSNSDATSDTLEMSQQQKIAAALTRAGITKPEAWAAAGVPFQESPNGNSEPTNGSGSKLPANPPDPESSAETSLDSIPPLILMKDPGNPTFLISSHSQQELVGSVSWDSIAMVLGGAALTVLGFYVLLFQHHLPLKIRN